MAWPPLLAVQAAEEARKERRENFMAVFLVKDGPVGLEQRREHDLPGLLGNAAALGQR